MKSTWTVMAHCPIPGLHAHIYPGTSIIERAERPVHVDEVLSAGVIGDFSGLPLYDDWPDPDSVLIHKPPVQAEP